MHSPLTPASPFPSLGFTLSRATAGFTCITQALFVSIKKSHVHEQSHLFGGLEGEKNQESGRSGLGCAGAG